MALAPYAVFLASVANAGILDDFERDSTTPRTEKPQSSNKKPACENTACEERGSHDDTFLDPLFDSVLDGMFDGVARFFSHGTEVTLERAFAHQGMEGINKRKAGSPLLPTFRASGSWQSIHPNVEGRDLSIEAGESLFSGQIRRTNFVESDPKDTLSLTYGLVAYRLSYGNSFELNLGLGGAELSGNSRTSGVSFTAPLIWQFGDSLALSLWQVYSRLNGVSVIDRDVGLMYFRSGLSASLGYRSVSNPVSSLSGPYVGLSYFY